MRITIQYWAQARQAAQRDAETIELDGPCGIAQLLQKLAQAHGEQLRRIVLAGDSTPHPSLVLVLRDQQVSADFREPLRDGDVLAIIPPIAGG